jgi:hypothetical protein
LQDVVTFFSKFLLLFTEHLYFLQKEFLSEVRENWSLAAKGQATHTVQISGASTSMEVTIVIFRYVNFRDAYCKTALFIFCQTVLIEIEIIHIHQSVRGTVTIL